MYKKEEIEPTLTSSKVAFLSNFPPVECGIATFTQDLISAMNKRFNPKLKSRVIALNDNSSVYNYNKEVIMEINREDIEDFINKAKEINNNDNIKLICIQHEFGIFGGEYGSYLIPFLETIEKPVVIAFHSVLANPDPVRQRIVRFICEKSSAIVVMANKAIDILHNDYGIDRSKIHLVHHGIPTVPFRSNARYKKKLRLENKKVISTFGLLSPGKGVEYMIRALPKLIKKYPDILYLVIGETHPKVRKQKGESYRNSLLEEVEKLGLKNHVKFYASYLSLKEIIKYLLASDIYVCTNLDPNQIVSGTLAYALGCGKAVVSTPVEYAKEVLAEERGMLAKFKDPASFGEAIDKILSNKEFKEKLENNAYNYSRRMIWSMVASKYLEVFNKVVKLREETTEKYPKIKLNHLKKLTDEYGCIQFSRNSIPDKSSGYTLDDNARALIVSVIHDSLFNSEHSSELKKIYLNFLERAQDENGNFKNNHLNENEILNPYSEDAFGRAIWSLGCLIEKEKNEEMINRAIKIIEKAEKGITELNSPRAKAFAIMGLYSYIKRYNNPEKINKLVKLADSLVQIYEISSSKDWKWFEDKLTYSNPSLSEALFLAYEITKNKKYLKIAEESFNFLSNIVFVNGCLHPIGESGWCKRNGERAFFDQQPLDAASMVQTCLEAYKITRNEDYYKKAILAFNWFLGKNHLNQMMYDESTGGCYDGLSKNNVNLNQGAESTIAYLTSRLILEEFKRNNK
ncbi:MAG: glycosyltransferase [Candidatus Pacearchaeota archaeon]|nr:glycosyltransferase [Candidatus Pacearchaeota archaeon]